MVGHLRDQHTEGHHPECPLPNKSQKAGKIKVYTKKENVGKGKVQTVLDMLKEEFADVELMNIGDSKRQRRIIDGTEEGRNIIKVLRKRNFID